MANRLLAFLQAPATYTPDWLARLARAVNNELSRLTAFAGEVTWDPASVNNGASTTKTVTVPGVLLNVRAAVRVFAPYPLLGMVSDGYVSADNMVTIVLSNTTGGAVNLASGVWGVTVENFVLT